MTCDSTIRECIYERLCLQYDSLLLLDVLSSGWRRLMLWYAFGDWFLGGRYENRHYIHELFCKMITVYIKKKINAPLCR